MVKLFRIQGKEFADKRLIGFCGYKGVGKTEAAKTLIDNLGYTDVQFSGALKTMLESYLQYVGVENTKDYTDGLFKNHRSRYFCDKDFRHIMQSLGTDWGRNMVGQDFWIRAWNMKIKNLERIVVSDVRFPDEVETIRDKGGIIIKIHRPKYLNLDEHESEQNFPNLRHDYEVVNDTIGRLRQDILRIEKNHFND